MVQTVEWKYGVWLVLVVALLVRFALALGVQHVVSQTPGRLCLISGDAEGYWELAGKLVAGDAYAIYTPPRYVMRMPGFPLILAIPRFLFGDQPFAARLMLVLLGTLGCGLTYCLGRELSGDLAGLIAAAYVAISPAISLFSVLFLSETAFAVAMLASLIAAAKLMRQAGEQCATRPIGRTLGLAGLTGGLIGLATYMRPTWILVGPGLATLWILFGHPPIRVRLSTGLSLIAGLGLTLAPWTIRNAVVTGHFVPTTLWVGPSLYDGLNPDAKGDSDMDFFERDQFMQQRRMSEYEMDQEYRRLAWQFVREHPTKTWLLALIKQSRYWSPVPNSDQFAGTLPKLVGWLSFLPLIVFAVVGLWVSRHDFWLLIFTLAPIFYFASIHLLFVGSLRYRLPAEYPLAVLSAIGVCQLIHTYHKPAT